MTLSFAEVFDFYQAAVYPDRGALAGAVAALVAGTGSSRVLDCACGTGLPALDLRALGLAVDCCDGDPLMLERFRANAAERGADPAALLLEWDDLGTLPHRYDYVMCRGNSLAYAGSWQRESPAPALDAVRAHLLAVGRAVAPGGYLHVDAPRTGGDTSAAYPPVTFRGQAVEVTEQVHAAGQSRRWAQRVSIGGQAHEFTRWSAALTGQALRGMLPGCGFEVTDEPDLKGERSSYHVLLARKVSGAS